MSLTVTNGLPDVVARQSIVDLAARIEREDGAPPLSDQALTQLASDAVTHVVVHDDARLIGYAQRADATLEVAAEPDAVAMLLDAAAVPPVQIWSHGRRSRLADALAQRGFARIRELHQLRRPMTAQRPLPDNPVLPSDVVVRPFEPGRDDDAWLAVNAAAFGAHPEQGRWTRNDLQARIDSDWFDASGFLLAERAGDLLGFHWTKIHPDGTGEVYVIGVSPAAQGLGLGNALLVRGLRHLAERGCPAVLLYVDGDNEGALRLYERAGFEPYDEDVQWAI